MPEALAMPAKLLSQHFGKSLPETDCCFRLFGNVNMQLFCMSMTGLSIAAATVCRQQPSEVVSRPLDGAVSRPLDGVVR